MILCKIKNNNTRHNRHEFYEAGTTVYFTAERIRFAFIKTNFTRQYRTLPST